MKDHPRQGDLPADDQQADDQAPGPGTAPSPAHSKTAHSKTITPEVMTGADDADLEVIQRHDGSVLSIALPGGTVFGWEWEQLADIRPSDLLHPEDQIIGRRARLWCAQTGVPQTVQLRVRGAGGRWVWSECRYEPVEFQQTRATKASLRDVSEHAMSQETLSLVVGTLRRIEEAPDLEEGLRESTRQVRRLMRFDRGYVWRQQAGNITSTIWVGDITSEPEPPSVDETAQLREQFSIVSPWWVGRDQASRDRRVDGPVDVLRVPVATGGTVLGLVEYESSRQISSRQAELVSSVFRRLADALQRKDVEHELDMARQQLAAAFNAAPVGMALVTVTGVFERVNGALGELIDLDPAALVGQRVLHIIHPHDADEMVVAFDELLAGSTDRLQREVRLVRGDESTVWTLLSAASAADRDGEVRQFIVQVTDISAQKAREFQLSGQADPDADPLETLDTYLQAQPHEGTVAMISIRLGAGLEASTDGGVSADNATRIRNVGKRLRSQIRNNDFFAQVAPDRFVVVAAGLPEDGGTLVETIRQRFENSVETVDGDLPREVIASRYPSTARAKDLLGDDLGAGPRAATPS